MRQQESKLLVCLALNLHSREKGYFGYVSAVKAKHGFTLCNSSCNGRREVSLQGYKQWTCFMHSACADTLCAVDMHCQQLAHLQLHGGTEAAQHGWHRLLGYLCEDKLLLRLLHQEHLCGACISCLTLHAIAPSDGSPVDPPYCHSGILAPQLRGLDRPTRVKLHITVSTKDC